MECLVQGGTKENSKGRITFFQGYEEYKTSDQSIDNAWEIILMLFRFTEKD